MYVVAREESRIKGARHDIVFIADQFVVIDFKVIHNFTRIIIANIT